MQKALILSGYPGSGKGTQGRLLASDLDWNYRETGFILRSLSSQDNMLGHIAERAIKNYYSLCGWEKGLLNKRLTGGIGNNVVIDGFARHKESINYIDRNFLDFRILYIKISKQKALERIRGRLYDKDTGETFFRDPTESSFRYTRKPGDESSEIIKKRLKAFEQRSITLLEDERKNGRVFEIDGNGTIDQVREKIQEIVSKQKNFFN